MLALMIVILVITIIATIAAFTGAYILRKKNIARRKLRQHSSSQANI
jgi:type II secretory pathway pseudopilin PulG